MKKTIMFAAMAVLTAVSCQKKEEPAGIPMKLVAEIPATRVSYSPDGNVLKTCWKANETISVITLDGTGSGARIVAIDNFTSTDQGGSTSAEFTGTFTGGSDPVQVIVLYPALTVKKGNEYATDPYTDYTASAVSVIYEAKIGSEYIDTDFEPLMAGNVDLGDLKNNTLTATLAHEMTVLKLTATFPEEARGKTLNQMEIRVFDSDDNLNSLERRHSWNYVNLPDYRLTCPGSGYNAYSRLYCNFVIPETGEVTLYFANCSFADQEAGNKWKFTATVVDQAGTFVATKTFKEGISFDKGAVYRLSVTLTPES